MRQRAEEPVSTQCGKEGKDIQTSIHPFPHSFIVPSLSTGGAPGPAPAFRAITIQFDEGR